MPAEKKRCAWCLKGNEQVYIEYHDKEWGVPVHDDQKLFEFLVLDAFQAGLSWITILKRREGFRKAFDGFDAKKIANYKEAKIQKLMKDERIIRNQQKIRSTVKNAQLFLKLREEFGSFDKYIWQFTGHRTIVNKWKSVKDMVATSKESDAMSKDMMKRGFRFVGSTICYAFMQAAGMVNDHTTDCFRYQVLAKSKHSKTVTKK